MPWLLCFILFLNNKDVVLFVFYVQWLELACKLEILSS